MERTKWITVASTAIISGAILLYIQYMYIESTMSWCVAPAPNLGMAVLGLAGIIAMLFGICLLLFDGFTGGNGSMI